MCLHAHLPGMMKKSGFRKITVIVTFIFAAKADYKSKAKKKKSKNACSRKQ